MDAIVFSLIIGFSAAVIDTAPMIIKKLDSTFTLSAFSFWVLMGFLVPRAHIVPYGWLNGVLISWIMVIPLLFLIYRQHRHALPQVIVTTTLLGAAVGYASYRLIP